MSRYGRSVTPAIGAMTTGCSSWIGPIRAMPQTPPSQRRLAGAGTARERPRLLLLAQAVLLPELLRPAGAGHHALAHAGVERMAVRAHFDSHVARGGTHLERRSAGARNRGAVVFGMNPLLHPGSPLRRESDGPSSGANIQAIIPHRPGGKTTRRSPAPSPMLKYWRLRHKSSTPRRGGCSVRARAFRWLSALLFVLLPASVVFAQPAPVRGGHLVVVQSAEPPILDPS